jgi:hypothetical protein
MAALPRDRYLWHYDGAARFHDLPAVRLCYPGPS